MIKKLIFQIFVLTLGILSFHGFCFAQDEPPVSDANLGGEAKCIIRGKGVPFKSGTTDANRLLLVQNEGMASGSILFQKVLTTDRFTIDASAQAFFGLIEDLDGFLAGKKLDFESSDSDLGLKKITPGNNTVIEVINVFDDETKGNLKGTIQLKSSDNEKATGQIKLTFESTIRKVTKSGETTQSDNGKVLIKCKFKDVPIVTQQL